MRGLMFLLLGLAVVGCDHRAPLEPTVTAQLDSVFSLRAGQQARVGSTPLLVRFVEVSEDSRCPIDAICVWAGDARVHVVVSQAGSGGQPLDLHTFVEPRSVRVGEYRLTLERLGPAQQSDRVIAQADYYAEFRVSHSE